MKNQIYGLIFVAIGLFTAKIGLTIHGSVFFAILDFFYWPIVWIKWILFEDVNMTIIQESFKFFFV